jgi:hypothetical protein
MFAAAHWRRAALAALGILLPPGGFLLVLAALLAGWTGSASSAPREGEAPWRNETRT